MTQPPQPMVIIADIAREVTQIALQQAVADLSARIDALTEKVDALVSQDATVLAIAQATEADVAGLATALTSIQTSVATLETEVAAGGVAAITPATMDALSKARTDLDKVLATAAANAAADVPPSAAP